MIEAWWPSVEQIMLSAMDAKIRVLGIVGVERGAGVSTLSQMLATGFARADMRALSIDFSSPRAAAETSVRATDWSPKHIAPGAITEHPHGYDLLVAPRKPELCRLFNNVEATKAMFAEQLNDYNVIIADLPPMIREATNGVNSIAIARACDAVVMVCVAGRTKSENIRTALGDLSAAGVQLSGTVMNERHNEPMWA